MWGLERNRWNPNPITKFFVMGFLGTTVVHPLGHFFEWAVVLVISVMYAVNGFQKESIKNIIIFAVLFFIPGLKAPEHLPFLMQMTFSLLYVFRMFYLPFAGAAFFMKTSDVGSIISSMDYLKIPGAVSIPIAVIVRFFPSFMEERRHIKMAMKIRGIQTKNPVKYLEYVAVPLLIISSNIADDIAKSAETKCIANPIVKTRYIQIGIKPVDFIYALTIMALVAGGWLC